MDNITVSIIMLTYKHEQFITRAIEGVVMQQTNFNWELIIADDCSPDGTAELCNVWSAKYNNIRYIRNSTNLGANRNFVNAYTISKGKYVALCEGDDFWIDALKLQKQVDILEATPSLTGCFHDARVVSVNDELMQESIIPGDRKQTTIVRRVDLCSQNIVPTVSLLFRKMGQLPEWFAQIKIGDYALHLLNGRSGNYHLINSVMASYRVFPQSNYEALSEANKAMQKIEMLSYVLSDSIFNLNEMEKYLLYSNYRSTLDKCKERVADFKEDIRSNMAYIAENYAGKSFLLERLRLKLKMA